MNLKLPEHKLESPRRNRWHLGKAILALPLLLPWIGSGATFTTAGSGNWDSTAPNAPWPSGMVPTVTDDVIIRAGDSILVAANATINSITFNNVNASGATLTVNAGVILSVTAGVTLQNSATLNTAATIAGAGTLTCASITTGGSSAPTSGTTTSSLTSTIFSLTVPGSLTVQAQKSGVAVNQATFALASGSVSVGSTVVLNAASGAIATLTLATGVQTGMLTLSGSTPFSAPGAGTATFTANGTGATVVYAGAAQTVKAVAYQNLTLSGSGIKTLTGVGTISGNLTLAGTVTTTTAVALAIGGNLDVGAGAAFTAAGFNLTVTGTTSVSGTLNHTSTTGTKTFTGDVTINAGGAWVSSVNEAVSFAGSLRNDGTFSAGTAVQTFTGSGKTFSGGGGVSIASLTITSPGAYQNNGTLMVGTALAGTGSLTQGPGAALTIGGSSGITTLSATASTNTVTYSGGAQTVKAVVYDHLTLSGSGTKTLTSLTTINSDLTVNGTATATTAANLTVGGNLAVGSGATLKVAAFSISVTGNTWVSGTLTHSSATGTKTYSGDVTINSGGTWNETANAAISFGGSLDNEGTLTAGTGVHTFTGTSEAFTNGINLISIPNVTLSGTYQNNGTLKVGTALAGVGTLTQGPGATLNIGGSSAIASLAASGNANTVNYTGAAQTVKPIVYSNLGLSGSGTKTLTGLTTINGNLSLSGTTTATTAANLGVGGNLTVGNGTTFTIAGFDISVSGTTTVGGALNHNSTTGTKTYSGDVTINSGGIWNETANAAIGFAGSLDNEGTLSAGTGVHTFSGTSETFTNGINPISIPNATVTGTYQNNGTLTVGTALAGGGTLTQGPGATLNIGGTSGIASLPATFIPNTVNYNGAAQTVKPIAYNTLSLSGSGAKILTGVSNLSGNLAISGTATISGNSSFTVAGALNYASTSGTTTLTASNPISVGSFNQTAGNLVDNGNTITITGTGVNTWAKSGGAFTATGTARFTGAAPQIGAFAFNNLAIDVGTGNGATLIGSVTVPGTGTLSLTSGTLTGAGFLILGDGANIWVAAGGLSGMPTFGTTVNVTYTAGDVTTGPELPASPTVLQALTISNPSGTVTLGADVTVNGTLTLTGIFAVGPNTLTLKGPPLAGTPADLVTTFSSSLVFGGSATGVSLPSSVTTLQNLSINNPNGVMLNSSPTVSGTLTLSNGNLTTGTNLLVIGSSGSISGASSSSYVNGSVKKAFDAAGSESFTFDIGDASHYAPIVLSSLNIVTAPASLTALVVAGDHPSLAASGIDPSRSVNRYWTLAQSAGLLGTFNATFAYTPTDVDASATASRFVVRKYNGAWVTTTLTGTPTTTSASISNQSGVGDFAIGDQTLDSLSFTQQPTTTTAGQTIAPAVQVQAQDLLHAGVPGVSVSLVVNSGTLNGTTQLTTDASGTVTFGDLSLNEAGSGKQLTATSYGKTTNSTTFTINPAVGNHLAFTTQPGLASPGTSLGQQPTIQSQDQYGNPTTVGLDGHLNLTVTLSSGTGPLQGTTDLDIGTNAGNGTVTFTDLRIDPAGNKQLIASATGLASALSAMFNVSNAAPVINTASFTRPRNVPLKLLISNLLTNATDANGDSLVLAGLSATSTNGASLITNATYILYNARPGGNVTDSFDYTVSDSATTRTGAVLVTMQADPIGTNFNVVAYAMVNGKPATTFTAVPGYTYHIQRTQDLSGTPIWTELSTTNAPPGGLFQYVDENPPDGTRFYRAINL